MILMYFITSNFAKKDEMICKRKDIAIKQIDILVISTKKKHIRLPSEMMETE